MNAFDRLRSAFAPRYELLEEVGQGATSHVYLANDLRYDRRVAVKVLREELSDDVSVSRFSREIQIAAKLQHPNIVPLYDSGTVLGLPYFVMPPMEGETLRARLTRERQLDLGEALAIAEGIGRALDYAHRHAVAHRDIKPDNVLLHLGVPLVADFGIAAALGRVSGHRGAVGTPEYASPEQASGLAEVNGCADVYSLACVLYEMVSGRPPFTGHPEAVIMQHLMVEARPLSALRSDTPSAVSSAVARALAKTPVDRFPTAGDFVRSLCGESRRLFAPRRSIAVLPFVNVTGNPTFDAHSRGVTDAVTAALTAVRGLTVTARAGDLVLDGRTVHVSELGRRLNADLLVLGSVRQASGMVRVASQLIEVADARYRWAGHFDAPRSRGFALEDEAAEQIAALVRDAVLPMSSSGARIALESLSAAWERRESLTA